MRRLLLIVLACLCPALGAWDHVLSPEAFFSVSPGVSYRQASADLAAYRGVTLMLAGQIADNTSTREGTTLEILCYTRDRDDRPETFDPGCGRFVVTTTRVLDPDTYRLGRMVTLTGTLRGQETRPLAGEGSVQPVFELGEIHLWPKPAERPERIPILDPWCDPWYHPWCGPRFAPFPGPHRHPHPR